MTRSIFGQLDSRLDLVFERTVMRSPEGQDFPNVGCYLDVVENEVLVWTNALGPGFRPPLEPASHPCDSFVVTGVIALAPHERGTRYTARVMHGNEEGRSKHEAMGFEEGWGKALDQLVAMVKSR